MAQQQKKFCFADQIQDSTVTSASRSRTVVNKNFRTYPNLVAKIQVYMSKKKSNSFFVTLKTGSYKNMLNFMAIV